MPIDGTGSGHSALVGRDAELLAVADGLVRHRILTLTGPPGVGKTVLALEAAALVGDRFRDGWLSIDLTSAPDGGAVAPEIARRLRAPIPSRGGEDALAQWLRDRELLLVLDNIDRVLECGPEMATLVRHCPGLRLLVTSRERMRVSVECELPVPPLAMPQPSDVPDVELLRDRASVALLERRARAVVPEFAVTAENADQVARICRRLDGLPLAIELVAANLKLFSPTELADHLEQGFRLPTGARRDDVTHHRTLRAAIRWSHDLLEPQERRVLRGCSVFQRRWSLDEATRVTRLPPSQLAAVTLALVDKSLVTRRESIDGSTIFTMLESVREFAAEQLQHSGQLELLRDRHAAYFAQLAEQDEADIGTPDEERGGEQSRERRPNFSAAIAHLQARPTGADALWLSAALAWGDFRAGELEQSSAMLTEALTEAPTEEPTPSRESLAPPGSHIAEPGMAAALAAAGTAAGIIAYTRGRYDDAHRLLSQGRELSRATGDERRTAVADSFLGHVARTRGRYQQAARHHQSAADTYSRLRNPRGVAWAMYDLGLLARERGEAAEADARFSDSLDRFRQQGDGGWATACVAYALGALRVTDGRGPSGTDPLLDAVDLFHRLGDARGNAQCAEALALGAALRGEYLTAARLLGSASRYRDLVTAHLPVSEREILERAGRLSRRHLGDRSFDRAHRDGRTMSRHAALALAHESAGVAVLTPRERDVAGLVAEGSTNRQIGRALGITERTVEVHVRHAMGKLDARSRAEVAAWAARQGLAAAPARRAHQQY